MSGESTYSIYSLLEQLVFSYFPLHCLFYLVLPVYC